jgi:hypothetical protein
VRRAIALTLALAALSLPACDLLSGNDTPSPSILPSADDRSPVAGQPPIAWIAGHLQAIAENRVTLRDRSDAVVQLQRLSGGTTRFLAPEGSGWRDLGADEVGTVEAGRKACAEVLLDGQSFVALRIFLDADCGPTGAAP